MNTSTELQPDEKQAKILAGLNRINNAKPVMASVAEPEPAREPAPAPKRKSRESGMVVSSPDVTVPMTEGLKTLTVRVSASLHARTKFLALRNDLEKKPLGTIEEIVTAALEGYLDNAD